MTSPWVPFLAALAGALVGGFSSYLVGAANDRRSTRTARVIRVQELVAAFGACARMMDDTVYVSRLRLFRSQPPSDGIERLEPRFDTYELEFYRLRTTLKWELAHSQLATHVRAVDNAITEMVNRWRDPTEPTDLDENVQHAVVALEDAVALLKNTGDAHFHADLTARQLGRVRSAWRELAR